MYYIKKAIVIYIHRLLIEMLKSTTISTIGWNANKNNKMCVIEGIKGRKQ